MNSSLSAVFFGLFAASMLNSCAVGEASKSNAVHRNLQLQKLPPPKRLVISKEDVVLRDDGSTVQVKFIKDSSLRLGGEKSLGLAEQSLPIKAGQGAAVISRLMGSDGQEYLYIHLHNSIGVQPTSTSVKTGNLTSTPMKISEGYALASDTAVVDPTKDKPGDDQPIYPVTPANTCAVNITIGSDHNHILNKNTPIAIKYLAGPEFRELSMKDSFGSVVFGGSVQRADISKVTFQFEVSDVTNGRLLSKKMDELCTPSAPKTQASSNAIKPGEFATSQYNTCKKMPEYAISKDKLVFAPDGSVQASFEELKFIPNTWMGIRISLTVRAMVADQEITCQPGEIQLMSPLVLDFSGAEKIVTNSVVDSKLYFDLMGNGRKVRTGWISGSSQAFLAMDLNGNGVVDSGSELFGDATIVKSGPTAANGFDALAQYDSNHDAVIDARDSAFTQLRLWFDRNQNGTTEKGELQSLKSSQVKSISLKYAESAQAKEGSLFRNNVLLEARFNGPKTCGKKGCKVYDVYFGTIQDASLVSK